MTLNLIRELYRRTPEKARKPIEFIPIQYRLGGSDFSDTYSFLEESEEWTRERLEQYQKSQLQELLEYAVKAVPYYQEIDLPYEDPVQNLKHFPIVDKSTMRNHKEEFMSAAAHSTGTHEVTTGGTSGEPFSFTLSDDVYGKEWAFIMFGWRRVGYSPGDQLITFKSVSYEQADQGKYWKYNPIYRTYEFSPFHITNENVEGYVEKIWDIDPKYIHGYPSAVTKLARYVQEKDLSFPKIKGVLAASENLYQRQRETIESVFRTRVFSHYGQSEKVALAAECEDSTNYHLYPQYGYTEILDEQDNEVSVGGTGEVVATGFLNRAMPFIRYRTDDYATKGAVGGCSCGRAYRILPEIQGRVEKERKIYITAENGVPIGRVYYSMDHETLKGVGTIQFYQERPGEIVVRVVPQGSADLVDEKRITRSIETKLGDDFEVKIKFMKDVELTDAGKKQLLIQGIEA